MRRGRGVPASVSDLALGEGSSLTPWEHSTESRHTFVLLYVILYVSHVFYVACVVCRMCYMSHVLYVACVVRFASELVTGHEQQ